MKINKFDSTIKVFIYTVLFGVILMSLVFGQDSEPPDALKIPGIFSDHMVLQRNIRVPVWGTSASGTIVTVSFNGQSQLTPTDTSGNWKIYLDNLSAGGPYKMTVDDGFSTIIFDDVLVGEVLLGSGQSNMEIAVNSPSDNPKKWVTDQETQDLVGDGNFPMIRISAQTRDGLQTPNGGWQSFFSEIRDHLPATMACVAIELQKELKVPIGILIRAVSSSPSGGWVSRSAIKNNPEAQEQLTEYAKVFPDLLELYKRAMTEHEAIEDLEDRSKIVTPVLDEYTRALKVWDIRMCTRCKIGRKPKIPPHPGMERQSWFQKNKDSQGRHFERFIKPVIPFGVGCIVWDQGEAGTGIGGVKQFMLMKTLINEWRKNFESKKLPFVYIRKTEYPANFEENMKTIPQTYMVDNRRLTQELHPRDKAAYAKRVLKVVMENIYQAK